MQYTEAGTKRYPDGIGSSLPAQKGSLVEIFGNISNAAASIGTAAKEVFEKMLWLNPLDNQGARFLLANLETGKTWQEFEIEEHA